MLVFLGVVSRRSIGSSRIALDLRLAVGRIARRTRQLYAAGDPASEAGFIEIALLSSLERKGPLTSKALADLERVTPQAIGSTLSALERRGYVTRASDQDDRRKVVTAITESGRATLASREQVISAQMTRALTQAFDAEERRQIAAAVPLLERLADEL
jgi:DNA-binding MarR family transcriptional regulator